MSDAFKVFLESYEKARPFLLQRKMSAELLTPVKAMLCLRALRSPELREPKFLLESVEGGLHRGRYSIIGLGAELIWSCEGGGSKIVINGVAQVPREPPLKSLKALLRRLSMKGSGEPPMSVGLFGYMGYDAVRFLEELPQPNEAALGVAESQFILPRLTVTFDAVDDSVLLTAAIYPFIRSGRQPERAWRLANGCLDEVENALNASPPAADKKLPPPESAVAAASNMSESDFAAAVDKVKQYILNGDIFQAVLSQRFKVPFAGEPFSFYRHLRRINPSPFLFYFDFGDFSVAGSSPEIMVRLRGGKVVVRPIAGTRHRGGTPEEDAALAAELLADPKEIAEHLMLLDLGRNDVAKVAKPGTVRVTERMRVEKYSHVMHMVSNVEGEVEENKDALDCLCAGFPAGTVSGAPKVRAMQIIDELESERRELYAGAVGYFSAFGEMDTCIALRTALIKDGTLHVQAGAGIVADSDPKREFLETKSKAKALIATARLSDSLTAKPMRLKRT